MHVVVVGGKAVPVNFTVSPCILIHWISHTN